MYTSLSSNSSGGGTDQGPRAIGAKTLTPLLSVSALIDQQACLCHSSGVFDAARHVVCCLSLCLIRNIVCTVALCQTHQM